MGGTVLDVRVCSAWLEVLCNRSLQCGVSEAHIVRGGQNSRISIRKRGHLTVPVIAKKGCAARLMYGLPPQWVGVFQAK